LENEHDHAGHDHAEAKYDIPQPREPLKALTAFLIVCMPDGIKAAYSDVNTPLELEREATLNDMFEGAAQVQRDVTIMQMTNNVVNNTVNGLMMAMQQQMLAAQDRQIANQVMAPPNRAQRRH
jgi:hypothetical protein